VKDYLKDIFSRTETWVFLLCLAVIHGASFHVIDIVNATEGNDTVSYLGLFNFDFNQYSVRKYRIIVPFAARLVHTIFGGVFTKLAPDSFPGDFAVGMSFLVVNNLIMALFGVFVFRFISNYCSWILASLVGLLSMLTCRWTAVIAGLPLVDSLYLLVLAMVLVGLKEKNKKLLIISIFLGPWAKESFIFIAPIIFFYAPIKKVKQVLFFAISGALVFSARYYIDTISGTDVAGTMQENFSHFGSIWYSLKRLFSFHGVYEVFSVTGFWILLVIPVLIKKVFLKSVKKFEPFVLWYIVSVLFQAILSTDIARMLFMLTPVFAALWAVFLEQITPKNFKEKLNFSPRSI